MVPLRIECKLSTPWAPPAIALHLDGLIAWSLVEAARATRADEPDYASIIADLPFQRHESGVWCASVFSVVNYHGQERRYLTAKTPIEHMASMIQKGFIEEGGPSTFDTVRGPLKAGQGYFNLEHAEGLRAWCIGDPDLILDALARVTAVGIKTRSGFGTLLPYAEGELWRVEEDPQAEDLWKHRCAPVQLTEDMMQGTGAFQPPYWRATGTVWRPLVRHIHDPSAQPSVTAAA